mgnify:FL=1
MNPESNPSIPNALVQSLSPCRSAVALTGAGISAESGVPTFRDAQTGLWAQYAPTELATPEAFESNPRRVWEWYAWRRQLVTEVQPNAGHVALNQILEGFARHQLVTQNVDGLHQIAGASSVIELHGNLHRTLCSRERTPVQEVAPQASPPACPNCGSPLRPDVVWFGESLPADALHLAIESTQSCDVFFSIGTSGTVYPAAELPFTAKRNGALVIEVNREPTPITDVADWSFHLEAGVFLPRLQEALNRFRH